MVVMSTIAISGVVLADPGPAPTPGIRYGTATDAIFMILVYNLPVNLLWLCIAVYAICRTFGNRVGVVPKDPRRFFGSIVIAAVIVTTLGSMIDFALLIREDFQYGLYFDAMNWTAAAALIFVSIYFSSILLLNLEPKVALIPAAAITAMNPVWWALARSENHSLAPSTAVVAVLLLPVFLALLWKWHRVNFPCSSPA